MPRSAKCRSSIEPPAYSNRPSVAAMRMRLRTGRASGGRYTMRALLRSFAGEVEGARCGPRGAGQVPESRVKEHAHDSQVSRVPCSRRSAVLAVLGCGAVWSQLPPEAVMLDKVKIPQTIKPQQIDPVTLKTSRPTPCRGPGMASSTAVSAASKAAFAKDPETIRCGAQEGALRPQLHGRDVDHLVPDHRRGDAREAASRSMATVSSGRAAARSATRRCIPENFKEALAQLRKRAEKSYELTGGKYTEGAKSPVEGAIDERTNGVTIRFLREVGVDGD